MGSTENCSVFDAVRFVPGRSPFLVPQKLTRSPDQTPTRSRRSEWAGRKARCCRAGFPCRQASPCVRADARIGPPADLADNCRFRITARLRVLCRAGDFARRRAWRRRKVSGTMPASSPTKHGASSCRTLPDISAVNRQRAPPSAPSGASTSPCGGGCQSAAAPKASPVRGGVAAGDGGVPHLAPPLSFRSAARPRLPA